MQDMLQLLGVAFGLPVLIALVISGKLKEPMSWVWALGAWLALTVNVMVVSIGPGLLPEMAFMSDWQWNWSGKFIAVLSSLLMYACLPAAIKQEAGIFTLPRPPEWRSVTVVSVALLAFFWGVSYLNPDGAKLTLETVVYQASLPGLDEEMIFRGILLAMLVTAFGKPWRIAGIQVGWGAMPVVVFFGLAHGWSEGIHSFWLVIFVTGVTGAGLLWLKERTGSIWVPVLVHNLANVGAQIVGYWR